MSPAETDSLGQRLERLVQEGLAREARRLRLPGRVPPWTDTTLHVERDDQITWLAEGGLILPPGLPGSGQPAMHLWSRIVPGGSALKAAYNTNTMRAAQNGTLEFGILIGEWKSPVGDFDTPDQAWSSLDGEIDVVVVNWGRADPVAGLERLAALGAEHEGVSSELSRLSAPLERPEGWSPHWLLGEGGVFQRGQCDGRPCMAAHTRDDVSIIRYETDAAVGPETTLHWRWRLDELPSSLPEDQLFQHDYLSIAAEFDCGRDLTWYWSSCLPVETWFTCPIPQWAPRETHCVARTGPEGLGEWHSEKRLLATDFHTALGEEPGRLVAVWLIAVSLFQHGEGRGWFSDIVVEHEGRRIQIPTE